MACPSLQKFTHHVRTMRQKPRIYLPLLDNGQGSCRVAFLESFIKSFSGQHVHIDRISDSHPGRGRNRAAANFLQTECEYLLFIDSDIIFNRGHVDTLMESAEPIVGGIYCLKQEEVKPCLQTLPGGGPIAVGGIEEIRRIGTGFLRISREVFEKLKSPENEYVNHGRREWDFFRSGVVDGEWLSEDWFFCEDARAKGFKVMVDTRVQVGHEGNIVYPLKLTPDRLTVCPPELKPFIEQIWKGEYAIKVDEPIKTVLDIGGNIGAFSVWMKEQFPDCEIEAFEPHPDNAAMFRVNTRQFKNVTVHQMAIRGKDCPHYDTLKEGNNGGEHSFYLDGRGGIEVPCLAAGYLASREFVKLDCEGCEYEILKDLDLSLTRYIVLEYHSDAGREAIRVLLSTRGFVEQRHTPNAVGRGLLTFKRRQETQ